MKKNKYRIKQQDEFKSLNTHLSLGNKIFLFIMSLIYLLISFNFYKIGNYEAAIFIILFGVSLLFLILKKPNSDSVFEKYCLFFISKDKKTIVKNYCYFIIMLICAIYKIIHTLKQQ